MAEKGFEKRDLEELFTAFEKRQDNRFVAFEKRQDEKLKSLEDRVIHQFHIISEGLIDQIKLLAEGHAGIVQRLDRVETGFNLFEKENERQHLETRALIKLSFSELDRRISNLESQVSELQEWKKQVEARLQI